jgi:hypothetical protein
MFREHHHADEIDRYVTAVRSQLAAPEVAAPAAAAAAQRGAPVQDPATDLREVLANDPMKGVKPGEQAAFFARNPATSLLQTSLDEETHKQGFLARVWRFLRRLFHIQKFGPMDVDWVTVIAAAMARRAAEGNHPFNPKPAVHADDQAAHVRLVIVGDWGSGLKHARWVSKLMADQVKDALANGIGVHVIHLGDVYYSGDPDEYRRRVLKPGLWPVTEEQAQQGVTSWSLNGNHDMYSGGHGYFKTLLADPRFANQHSDDGEPTSFFRLRLSDWDIVGLDTSWDPDIWSFGAKGVLQDPQAEVLAGWIQEGRKVMLLSHHQYVTVYDPEDIGTVLEQKLGPLLANVKAWLWGHEHRCMAFTGHPFMRCIGHGGIPTLPKTPDPPPPPPGLWKVSGDWKNRDGTWANFGYAVVDIKGPDATIRYFDDTGGIAHPEEPIP